MELLKELKKIDKEYEQLEKLEAKLLKENHGRAVDEVIKVREQKAKLFNERTKLTMQIGTKYLQDYEKKRRGVTGNSDSIEDDNELIINNY